MPDPQLRCTVQPGVRSPQPRRSPIILPILASFSLGMIHPMITSSRSLGANGWSINKFRPAHTAKSDAENGPGRPRAFKKGVRNPSTTYTGLALIGFMFFALPQNEIHLPATLPNTDLRKVATVLVLLPTINLIQKHLGYDHVMYYNE